MSFQDLPSELLCRIVHFISLDGTRLASFNAVSPHVRDVIEIVTFAQLKINSDDLGYLTRVLQHNPTRCRALGTLHFAVVLPTYSQRARAFLETIAEQGQNDEHFSRAIAGFFNLLKICDLEDSRPLTVSILHPYTTLEWGYRSEEQEMQDLKAQVGGRFRSLAALRFKHSYLQLLHADRLPTIKRVRHLEIRGHGPRSLAQAVPALLSCKFQNLESSHWYINDGEKRHPDLRFRLRQDLAKAISHPTMKKLATKSLMMVALAHEPPRNHSILGADVRGKVNAGLDDLSVCLGNYLRFNNLVKVTLAGPICIAPELLWHEGLTAEQLCWPNVESIWLEISPISPCGAWYLVRDPFADFDDHSDGEMEYVHSDEEVATNPTEGDLYDRAAVARLIGDIPSWRFRAWPAPELVNFFKAVARAARYMPKIRFILSRVIVQDSSRTKDNWGPIMALFVTRGNTHPKLRNTADMHLDRLQWAGPEHWKPDEELESLWRLAVKDELLVRYEHW